MKWWLDRTWFIERAFYRHHRLTGILVVILSLVMYQIMGQDHQVASGFWSLIWWDRLRLATRWLLMGFSILGMFLGLMIVIRPSALKSVERLANRWYY